MNDKLECKMRGCFLPAGHDGLHQVLTRIVDYKSEEDKLVKKVASMIWALSVSYSTRADEPKYVAADFADQKLINKSPYYELAQELIPIIKEAVEKERLDRPKLRKGILPILDEFIKTYDKAWLDKSTFGGKQFDGAVDQILALIPDERKKIAEEIKNMELPVRFISITRSLQETYTLSQQDLLKAILDKLKGEK